MLHGVCPRFGFRHIRIKATFDPAEVSAMRTLSTEVRNRLEAVAPDLKRKPERLEQVSQWMAKVMATIVRINNAVNAKKGIPGKERPLSAEEKQFLQLSSQITQHENLPLAQAAVKSLLNLFDAERGMVVGG